MKKKTETTTLRLNQGILDKLLTESTANGITLNALVNQVLKRYTEWDSFEPKVGLMSVPKEITKSIFDILEDGEITQIAEQVGKIEYRNMVLIMQKEFDFDSFLDWLEKKLLQSNISITRVSKRDRQQYIINHNMGRKWAYYHQAIIEMLNKEYFKYDLRVDFDDKLLIINILNQDNDNDHASSWPNETSRV